MVFAAFATSESGLEKRGRKCSWSNGGPKYGSGDSGQAIGSAQQQSLNLHNEARRERGTPPLVWSTTLEQAALSWSKQQAADHRMHHSGKQGENIAAVNDIVVATRMFIAEKDKENNIHTVPQYFTVFEMAPLEDGLSNLQVFGHYMQVIWRSTREVGCASYGGYTTCRYNPPGNKGNGQVY